VPKVARNSLIALAALADDGGLHGLGDTRVNLRGKDFERGGALIA